MVKKAFILFYFFGIIANTSGQETALKKIESGFTEFHNKNIQEKVFVHTDRNFYLTGDNMWFKVYTADAGTNKPLDLSAVAYVEILDAQSNPVLQTKIKLDAGSGSGSLFIPASLNSGNYIFRTYTRWMRNFDPAFYFNKTITIVNPFKPLDAEQNGIAGKFDIQFFPEGGNMVAGVENKIAFRAVDADGKGIRFRGVVLADKTDTVAVFSPFLFGIGHFNLIPEKNRKYSAILFDSLNRPFAMKELPVVHENGYVLKVDNDPEKIQITVTSSSLPGHFVYLVIHSGNRMTYSASAILINGNASFSAAKSLLPDGISHITLFNPEYKPVCERLFFKQPVKNQTLTGSTDAEVYGNRKKIILDISSQMADDADLSVSVFRTDTFPVNTDTDIRSYMLLTSELKGNIESPAYYLGSGDSVTQALDNLMLTHGWSRYSWDDIFNRKPDITYVPEHKHQIVEGKILHSGSNEPYSGVITYLSIPSRLFHINSAVSDENGTLFYEIPDNFRSGKMLLQTNYTKDSLYQIRILPSYSDKYAGIDVPSLHLEENYKNDLIERSVNMQVRNIYNRENMTGNEQTDSLLIYGKPDEQYYLDDFTRFTVMEEVLREYVPGVLVRKHRGNFNLLVFDHQTKTVLEKENTLILLDGVPLFNANDIMNYDPLKIQRLDVVGKRYYNKIQMYEGVISFITYRGDLDGFSLNPNVKSFDFEGLQAKKEFFSPVYETSEQLESRLPDFRDLLYWNPGVRTGKNGKVRLNFYSSDQKGKYQIVIQGLTKNGAPVYLTSDFKVSE